MGWFGDICEAFDVKPNEVLSVIGGVLSLGGLIVSGAQAAYKDDDDQKRLEELVRKEVAKSNGRGYR